MKQVGLLCLALVTIVPVSALAGGGTGSLQTAAASCPDDRGLGCWVSGPTNFSGVKSSTYWSSTTFIGPTDLKFAWIANLNDGIHDTAQFKPNADFMRPIRGGQ